MLTRRHIDNNIASSYMGKDSRLKLTPEDLAKLKPLKKFSLGNNSLGVWLMEHKVVKKVYPAGAEAKFDREVKFMKILRKYKYISHLIYADRPKLTLWVTYVGKQPKKTPENRAQIRRRAEEIDHRFGVVRIDKDTGKVVRNIFVGNTGITKGKIYLFDFGGSMWKHIPSRIKG